MGSLSLLDVPRCVVVSKNGREVNLCLPGPGTFPRWNRNGFVPEQLGQAALAGGPAGSLSPRPRAALIQVKLLPIMVQE